MSSAELISREQNIAHLKITLDPEEVDSQYKKLYREYAKELKLPGFRKGKVPTNVIRQRLGAENVDGAAGDYTKEYAIKQALEQLKLTYRHGKTTWHTEPTPAENQPLEYEVSIPVLPEVKLPDYSAYNITVPLLKVTDSMKQLYRDRLIERFTEYPPKDGVAQEGEALKVGFSTVYKEDDTAAPFAHDEMIIVLGKEGNMPGWDDYLLGRTVGDVLEFDYSMPTDFADPRVAGKDLEVHIEVKDVLEVKAPELNEDFIKAHFKLDSQEEFNSYIEASLSRERDQQAMQMKRELTMQKVVEELEAELSDDMVNDELDGLIKENDRSLRQYDSSLEQFLKEKGQSLPDYRESLKEAAIKKIRTYLAVKEIAESREFTVTTEDFQRYALMLMQQEGMTPEQFKKLLQYEEFVSETNYQIIREKVLDHLASSASFNEEEVDSEKAGEEAEEQTEG